MDASKAMFEALMQVFEEANMPYCVLAGYDGYPEVIPSDIDFMLPPEWSARLPALLKVAAARMGGRLVQCIAHETTAEYFAIARLEGDRIAWLHPDSCSDFRRGGTLLLRGDGILQRRRRHRRGFWVPAAADAFAYYLIKKLDKGGLNATQAAQLSARYAEDPQGCAAALTRILPAGHAAAVDAAAATGHWRAVIEQLPELTAAMVAHAAGEPFGARQRQRAADLRRMLGRLLRPTGLCIAFLGPDGSGKSSVINRVSSELAQGFRRVDYRHLRPPLFSRGDAAAGEAQIVVDPHARPPRGLAGSAAKLLHFWGGYLLGSLSWLYPRRVCSRLVIFDRYYHDILADPRRYRFRATPMLARLAHALARRLPQPDLIFVLDAAPEILQARKQEVPLAETARQRQAYLRIAADFAQAQVIDAGQPLEHVVADVLAQVVALLEARTHRRLGLDRMDHEDGVVPWKA